MAWRTEYDERILDLFYLTPGNKYWLDPTHGSDGGSGNMRNPFKTWANGYGHLRDGFNDSLFIVPGSSIITVTAEIDFTKSYCNVIGLGSPNVQGRYAASGVTPAMPGGATIYTATAAVGHTLHVTGERNRFENLHIVNFGNNAGNFAALKVGGCGAAKNTAFGNYFKNCNIQGIGGTSVNTKLSGSLIIGSGAAYFMFEDCLIGQNTYGGDRATAYQGHLYYEGVWAVDGSQAAGYGPQNGRFKKCKFFSRGTTNTVVMVRIGLGSSDAPTAGEEIDREQWFEECTFSNWPGSTAMLSVFDYNCAGGPGNVKLSDCKCYGYDQWRAVRPSQVGAGNAFILTNSPVSNAAHPGEAVEPTS